MVAFKFLARVMFYTAHVNQLISIKTHRRKSVCVQRILYSQTLLVCTLMFLLDLRPQLI